MSEVQADVVLRGGVVFVAGHRELADVAVFERDIFSASPEEVLQIRCHITIVDGDVAHDLHAELAG